MPKKKQGGARPGAGRPSKPREALTAPYRRRIERAEKRQRQEASRPAVTLHEHLHAGIGPHSGDMFAVGLDELEQAALRLEWATWDAMYGFDWRIARRATTNDDLIALHRRVTGRDEQDLRVIRGMRDELLARYTPRATPDPPGLELAGQPPRRPPINPRLVELIERHRAGEIDRDELARLAAAEYALMTVGTY